jgi:hypothetical protein
MFVVCTLACCPALHIQGSCCLYKHLASVLLAVIIVEHSSMFYMIELQAAINNKASPPEVA